MAIWWVLLPMIVVCCGGLMAIPLLAWRDVGWAGSALLACLTWPSAAVFSWAWWQMRKFA